MKIKQRGNLESVTYMVDISSVNRAFSVLRFSRRDALTGGWKTTEYLARSFKAIRIHQKVANLFTIRALRKNKDATITIRVNDVTDHELDRVIKGIKQSTTLHEFGGNITSIVRVDKLNQETS